MGYGCKICGCNFFNGYRFLLTIGNLQIIFYICESCRGEKTEEEVAQLIKKKAFH